MTYCPNCGSSVRSGSGYCQNCGEIIEPTVQMPPLDPKNPEPYTAGERMESFPPLLKIPPIRSPKAANAGVATAQPHVVRQMSGGRNFLLLTVIACIRLPPRSIRLYRSSKERRGSRILYM